MEPQRQLEAFTSTVSLFCRFYSFIPSLFKNSIQNRLSAQGTENFTTTSHLGGLTIGDNVIARIEILNLDADYKGKLFFISQGLTSKKIQPAVSIFEMSESSQKKWPSIPVN